MKEKKIKVEYIISGKGKYEKTDRKAGLFCGN